MRIVSRSNNEKIHRAVFYLARTEDRELVVHAHSPRSFLSRWKVDDKKNVQETVSFVPTIATDTKRCYARSFSLFVHAPIVLVACALIAQPVSVWRFIRCACSCVYRKFECVTSHSMHVIRENIRNVQTMGLSQ